MRARWWGTTAALATAVCGTLIVQGMTEGPAGAGDDKAGPVRNSVQSAPLTRSTDGTSATLARRTVTPFTMLGVTWSNPTAEVTATVEVRTREATTRTWSNWLVLDAGTGAGETAAKRGGTEPAWVGASDGVEVRIAGKRTTELPDGLRLDMIGTEGRSTPKAHAADDLEPAAFLTDPTPDPTPDESRTESPTATPVDPPTDTPTDPEPSASPTESPVDLPSETPTTPEPSPSETTPEPTTPTSPTPSPSPTIPTAPASTVPQPTILPRSAWRADESLSPEASTYLQGGIKAVVVHHTASSSDYTCEEAPAIINAIYTYDVTTLGWRDLGYNFVVDKCGTVYEGRKGGIDLPVVGSHAYGFNSQTTGIAVLGTYTDSAPPLPVLTSVARVAAWKLGQYGVAPDATVTLTTALSGRNHAGRTWAPGETLTGPAIQGHRDSFNTQCPGDALYAALSTVRTLAAGPVTGLTLKSLTGTALVGSTPYTNGPATVAWSADTPVALITSYEVLVDGKAVVSLPGTTTSARVTLTPGSHQVQVRAVHQSGRAATSAGRAVVVDATAPAFPVRPNLVLRTGTVNTAAVPVTLGWKASDATALKEVRLTAPLARTYGPTVTGAAHTAKSGAATAFTLRAYDTVGNSAAASVSGTPVIAQETAAVRSGAWTAKSSTNYLGGKSLTSGAKNASLTWTFTGRSVGWVVSRAATSGQADIYLDGKKVTTIDLKSSTTAYRNVVWTKSWAASAQHTLKIVVRGTTGRPAVTTDGIVSLK
ncbi:peptidoglycan recognition protein [Streptomyces sp. NPDC004539]|uniref:peptidoglycan recognition protein family protein n=1 Tax=Streptomyces sp. NPDC004539 TaxID=3154280 RepID=UPI0033B3B872